MLDNGRIKMQAAADANYLSIALYEPVMLDNIAVRLIQEDRPEFLLPLQIKVINDQQSLRYKLVNAVSLSNNIPKSMTKRAYIKLALDLLTPFVKCRDWFLDYHYICVDPQLILYNKQNGGYLFVYMPELSLRNEDEDIIRFFDGVLNRISITDDPYYQVSIMTYFRDGNVTLTEMYDMFWSEREKSGGMPSSDPVSTRPPINDPTPASPPIQEPAVQNSTVTPPASNGSMITENSVTTSEGGATKGGGFFSGVFGGNKGGKKETTESVASNSSSGGGLFSGTAGTENSAEGVVDSNDFDSLFGSSKPVSGSGLFGSKKTEDKSVGGGLFGGKKTEDKPSGGGLFGGKKTDDKSLGGGLFGGNKSASGASAQAQNSKPQPQSQPTSAPQPQPTYQPTMNSGYSFGGDDFNSDETSIGGDGSSRSYLELLDSRFPDVPHEISLDFDKPYITIGRRTNDGMNVDVPFPDHCKGISRQHARIFRDGGGYFITDLGSAYHTLIDGRRLVPNMNEPIHDGMIITFVEEKPIRYRVRCGGY